ncbi:zinc finger MYM-type protein 1-like [Aphis craccivora]|uniref:Zinc finger MYM-type protein 1-like n=1 Tax=Aphis craccivora TaxID=307492 RepID=A0A6G0YUZ9_APHCR|nr:zinc finger MYM-type protein 1-like [Aphis craccivora]
MQQKSLVNSRCIQLFQCKYTNMGLTGFRERINESKHKNAIVQLELEDTKKLCIKWKIPFKFNYKREVFIVRHKKLVDTDRTLSITEEYFKINILYITLDTLNLDNTDQLKCLKMFFILTLHQLPNITVAFAERTFSKLKLIKNYLKNTISQERLKILQFSISKEKKTSKINIDKTIYGYTFKDEKKNSQIVQLNTKNFFAFPSMVVSLYELLCTDIGMSRLLIAQLPRITERIINKCEYLINIDLGTQMESTLGEKLRSQCRAFLNKELCIRLATRVQ